MARLDASIVCQAELAAGQIDRMFEIFSRYYDAVSADGFLRDLRRKDYVICLRDALGALQGFTTIEVIEREQAGKRLRAIFSGDTIIDTHYRGEQTLPVAFARLAGRVKASAPDIPLYWFLIVKGDKTYRYLPAFLREFYPSFRWPTPSHIKQLMDRLAADKFGANYDPIAGVVRFERSQGHLRAPYAAPEPGRERRADVRYFLQANPGYLRGEELVCLAELSAANLRSIGRAEFLSR